MAASTKHTILLLLIILLMAGCSIPDLPNPTSLPPIATASAVSPTIITVTPPPSPVSTIPLLQQTLRFSDAVPTAMLEGLMLPDSLRLVAPGELADLTLTPVQAAEKTRSTWVYALVAPFPTIVDNVPLADLRAAWMSQPPAAFKDSPLLISASTLAALQTVFGKPAADAVQVLEPQELLDAAWQKLPAWAIIPFEELEPRWKVLSVGGVSPLDKDFDQQRYPLVVGFGLDGLDDSAVPSGWLPAGNRDPEKMTVLVMSGVTALARGTAERMDMEGITYPAAKIREWLRDADLTHISNEVSFYADCPLPERRDPRFCSDPKYLDLLQDVDTNIVELTGNHLVDWGAQPFLDTLEVYRQQGWGVYGGGENLEAARQALLLEDHGNRIAFLGCNPAGPETDWAGEDAPGTAPCDYPALSAEVQRLKDQGYVVVVTFQHIEVCTLEPHLSQKADFQKPADAGAAIVSGSQAHCPQAMALQAGQFIHYGLGNLFFDQMDMFASRVMIDRHVIYNGHHVSTQLLSAQLVDRAQPRPMTITERQKLLEDIFRASGWIR